MKNTKMVGTNILQLPGIFCLTYSELLLHLHLKQYLSVDVFTTRTVPVSGVRLIPYWPQEEHV
jgi:hypothetical protein